jgi:hypothetical protein
VASFDTQGGMQQHTERAYRLNLTADQLAEARRSGLLYSLSYPADKPGPYHVRMAVQETSSNRVGTATQFLVAPDLKKKRLALSDFIIKGLENTGGENSFRPSLTLLRLGKGLEWEALAHHPKLKQGSSRLTATLRLYQDGQLVQESKPVPVAAVSPKKPTSIPVSGSLWLQNLSVAGEYQLQLIVTDENDKAKTVTQAVAFQLAP